MIGLHLGVWPSQAFHGAAIVGVWLLETSDWTDAGIWVDTANWSD